jgi:hypothetical protein
MAEIQNASPMVYSLGTRDLSTRVVPVNTLDIPQHLPKFYIYSESGPAGPSYIDLGQNSLTEIYGDETFNVESKYYTHQTPFLQVVASAGNNCVIHRLIAPDATDTANVTMYLDVLPTEVPVYVKSIDGSLALDNLGNPIIAQNGSGVDITVTGYKVCWVADHTTAPVGTYQPGLKTVRPGVQVEGPAQSTQYPMYEVSARYQGEKGAKTAIRLYPALQTDLMPFPSYYLSEGKVFPFFLQVVELASAITGKTTPILSQFGSQFSRFSSKRAAIDSTTAMSIDFDTMVKEQYIETTVTTATGLGGVHAYFANIDAVLTMLYDAEKMVVDPQRDDLINDTEQNIHALNSLSFVSSNGSPYQAIKLVDVLGSTRLTRNTNVFLRGTTDGTITETLLDAQVAEDMALYNDATSEYNDLILHPESIIYDSGFALNTKRMMPKMIARRKDTFVILSTFSHINPASLPSEQVSIGIALKTMMELYPESEFWGTPVMRGMIMAGSGNILYSLYKERLPVAYEVAYRSARYMGASNGAWKNGFIFDRAPGSLISQMKNVDATWIPASARSVMWSIGINFTLTYKVRTQFFPALQTVYENDTSVLNSYFVAVAISYLNKVAHAAWREFTGTISLTNAQLEDEVNKFISNAVKDKFDDKFKIVPAAKVTELDDLRGYSWTLPIKLYANNMRTVMTTYVEAYRMTDYKA